MPNTPEFFQIATILRTPSTAPVPESVLEQEAIVRALASCPDVLSEDYAAIVSEYLQRLPREVAEIMIVRGILAHLEAAPTAETLTACLLHLHKLSPANQLAAVAALSAIGSVQAPGLARLVTEALWKDETFRALLEEANDCRDRTPESFAEMMSRIGASGGTPQGPSNDTPITTPITTSSAPLSSRHQR